MTVSADQFRQDFPAFSDTSRFPKGLLNYWLNYAYNLLNAGAFGNMLDNAAELYAAHNISLERKAMDEGALGASPGGNTGPINSKGVDKASVGYDTGASTYEGAGAFNLTVYGTRLWDLIQMFGATPLQSNIGQSPPWVNGAWVGPAPWPGWFG